MKIKKKKSWGGRVRGRGVRSGGGDRVRGGGSGWMGTEN